MHVNAPQCSACADKLKAVHPDLVRWVGIVRATHPDCHVSWGFRNEADQETAWKNGKSKAHFGQSSHNTTPATGVDLFRLTQSGGAAFEIPWFRDIIAPIALASGLVWGGNWLSIKDYDHFELPGFVPFKA